MLTSANFSTNVTTWANTSVPGTASGLFATPTANSTRLRMTWTVSAFAPAAVGLPRGGRASCRLSLEKRLQMRLVISKSVLIHQPRTPPNKSYAPPLWSACVRCLISSLYFDLFSWHSALLFSFQGSAAPTLLFGATGFRLQVLGQVSQRHFPIVSDGYIYFGLYLIFIVLISMFATR